MRLTVFLALLFTTLVHLPVQAELVKLSPEAKLIPGTYIVFDDGGKGLKGLAAVHGEVVQNIPLQNFPSGWLMRLSPEMAELLGREGYTVIPQFLLELPREPRKAVQGPPVPSWHLDRDDQRKLPLDGLYRYTYTGAGVRAYVIDEGILPNPDFADRLESAPDFVGDGEGPNTSCGQPATHGTFVADCLGGAQYGVAKGVTIVPLRVYRCDQTFWGSAFYEELDFVLTDLRNHPGTRGVVNMSFGGPGIVTHDDPFFRKLVEAGVILVAAAGNDNGDTCKHWPAASTYVIAAGGTNRDDLRYSFSNYGRCTDTFAPVENAAGFAGVGDQVWYGSGTSLAAPQVVGHIAQLLEQFPDASPALIKSLLLANATPGVLGANIGTGSPNLLLYTGAFQEAPTRFIPRWFPAESRFTLQVAIGVPGGGASPADEVKLFRGPKRDGRCQGQPFQTAKLQNGTAIVTIRGWKQAPAFVCAETSLGTVFDRFVRTLN